MKSASFFTTFAKLIMHPGAYADTVCAIKDIAALHFVDEAMDVVHAYTNSVGENLRGFGFGPNGLMIIDRGPGLRL
jgi:hypothetical protein